MKRITLTVGLDVDVDHDTRPDDVIHEVRDAIAEHVTLADELRHTVDGVHVTLTAPPAPSVESFNHAVDVANANYQRAEKAEADLAEVARQRDAYTERARCLRSRLRNSERLRSASPPVPSGWQQRIAAMSPWTDASRWYLCHFCGAEKTWDDVREAFVEQPHEADCLWQNAKDALPPAPSPSTVKTRATVVGTINYSEADASSAKETPHLVCPMCEQGSYINKDGRCTCGRLAVEAGASPTPATGPPETVRVAEADASPAQDPIAAAVDAHLKPLGDELKAIGHKLEEQNRE